MRPDQVKKWLPALLLFIWCLPLGSLAQETKPLSITLEGYAYPYKVDFLNLNLEGQDLRMAYMDIMPAQPNGKTVLTFTRQEFFWGLLAQNYRLFVSKRFPGCGS